MPPLKFILRKIILSSLGLLGVALLFASLRFGWQGGPIAGVLMVMVAGGMLAGIRETNPRTG